MGFRVTTTGTVNPVVINDLNGLSIPHPTVDLDLEIQFTATELSESVDLQAAITNGELTAQDDAGNPITNVQSAFQVNHFHEATQINYDNSSSGLTAIEVQAAIDEIDTTLDNVFTSFQPISEKDQPNGYAGLDGSGLIDPSQLPSIAITEVSVVADIPARDALVVQEGDVAIVLDSDGNGNQQSYIYDGSAWQILSLSGAIYSVNGQTGTVVLNTDDIAEGATNLYYTDARVDARIALASIGDLNDVDLTGLANGQVLAYNSVSGNFEPTTLAPSGEINTASNVNVGGVGVFKQKNVFDLEFYGLNAGSNQIQVALDAGNNEIDISLLPANILTSTLNNDAGFVDAAGAAAAAPVQSVFGRTGAVVALASDYDANQIDFDNVASGLAATNVQAAIDEVEARVDLNDAKVSADGSIDTHSDVDTTTNAPSNGDVLEWDGSNWVPGAPNDTKRSMTLHLKRQGGFSNDWMRIGSSGIKTHQAPFIPQFAAGMKIREIVFSHRNENGASSVTSFNVYCDVIAGTGNVTTSDTNVLSISSTSPGVTLLTSNGRTWKYDATADNVILTDLNRYAFRISETGNGQLRDVHVTLYLEEA